ncbi:hypothetical protein NDU88_000568, partial [Pleurodeles waltl]
IVTSLRAPEALESAQGADSRERELWGPRRRGGAGTESAGQAGPGQQAAMEEDMDLPNEREMK